MSAENYAVFKDFIFETIKKEEERQAANVELIASENFVSADVLKAMGSVLTNKYCEGYPSRANVEKFKEIFPDYDHAGSCGRYYGGCDCADMVELATIYAFQKLFNTDYHVNVQPHSGSSANLAAYLSVLNEHDKVLSLELNQGGHLTHGSPVNFSGRIFDFTYYPCDEDGYIDMEKLRQTALEIKPKLILAGASAYSRVIDFKAFREICDEVGAYFMVDMAHIAGLVAAGEHPSPFEAGADIITTTTHKTLRGPRGGLIFCKRELARKVDSAVFPGSQGGPLMHVIAAKGVAAAEALQPEFKEYMKNVKENCAAMAKVFTDKGYKVITGGTDNHLFLLDLSDHPLSGNDIQKLVEHDFITLNKNCVPNEKRKPYETSGVRIGTAPMTSKGFTKEQFEKTAEKLIEILEKNR